MAAAGYRPIPVPRSGKRGGYETVLPPGEAGPGAYLSRRAYQERIGAPLGRFKTVAGPAGPEYRQTSKHPLVSVTALRKEIDELPRTRCLHILLAAEERRIGGNPDDYRPVYTTGPRKGQRAELATASRIHTHQQAAAWAAEAETMQQFAEMVLGGEVENVRAITLRPVECGENARAEQYREARRREGYRPPARR